MALLKATLSSKGLALLPPPMAPVSVKVSLALSRAAAFKLAWTQEKIIIVPYSTTAYQPTLPGHLFILYYQNQR